MSMSNPSDKRVYFVSEMTEAWIKFKWQDGSVLHRAWGNEKEPKFILQALVKLYWVPEAKDIYNKISKAMLYIDEMDLPRKNRTGKTASFVLYKRHPSLMPTNVDDNIQEVWWPTDIWPSEEIHSGEQKPSKGRKNSRKTASTKKVD